VNAATRTLDGTLAALEFDAEIACEGSDPEHAKHAADAILVVSCGCAPALCAGLIERARVLDGMPGVYCPTCYAKSPRTLDVRPLS